MGCDSGVYTADDGTEAGNGGDEVKGWKEGRKRKDQNAMEQHFHGLSADTLHKPAVIT